MLIYNTLKKQKEEFVPQEPGKVKMYVCGVTVYDYCHLGHARAFICFDMVHRYLTYKGFDVTFVRNFTDIDDKIIKRSQELNTDWKQLTQKYIQAFHEDAAALGFKEATHEPLATDHIQEIITIIKGLEEKGMAYESGGDVFYSVRQFQDYGKLSGKNIEDLEVGARVDVQESKRDPLDFALWKASKPGEPSWPSPWGDGRPGWHIECSAMSMKILSETFDIHGGGRDLIFPHHENEIAQSEGCTGKTFARYWIHNGFVNIDAEKMSKSLDNFMVIRDILKHYPGEVVRLFVLSSHYRSPIDYTDQNILNAASGLERFYEMKSRLEDFVADASSPKSGGDWGKRVEDFKKGFVEAMDDDFNSAKVVGQVFEWVRILNKALDEGDLSVEGAQGFLTTVTDVHQALGVFGSDAKQYLEQRKAASLSGSSLSEQDIQKLIAERAQARKDKNFARSDEIRDELKSQGIQLKDNPDGTTTWSVC